MKKYIMKKCENSNKWYIHVKGYEYIKVFGSSFKNKKDCIKMFCDLHCIPVAQFNTIK